MAFNRWIATCSLVVLAGCTSLSTSYVRPDIPAGPGWVVAPASRAAQVNTDRWWLAFGDPGLDTLVGTVTARNNDIFAAALRAHRARLQADLAAGALFPKLNGSLASSAGKPFNAGASTTSSSASLGVSYEIDIWGKLASRRDAASFEAQATAEDHEAARLAAIGATIENYFRLAHANQMLAAAEKSLAYVRQTQAFVRTQAESGAVSELELREVEQTVEAQAARIAELKQARLVLRNAQTVLLNGEPSPVAEPQRLPRVRLPAMKAGLPAELLARRPDLRAAELRLRATLKGVDETRAGFYPAISLTGGLGTSSDQLLAFIANPVATLGAGVALSFLNLKDMNLTIAVSRTQYEDAAAGFRTALLNAFADVANALGARATYAEQMRRQRKSYAAAQEVERLTETRYRSGAVALRIWVDAQERLRTAENAIADLRLAQLINESTLYRTLGGSPAPTKQVAATP